MLDVHREQQARQKAAAEHRQQREAEKQREAKFQAAWVAVAAACIFDRPKWRPRPAETAYRTLAAALKERGWAAWLPDITANRRKVFEVAAEPFFKNEAARELVVLECLRLALDKRSRRGAVAKELQAAAGWCRALVAEVENVQEYLAVRARNDGEPWPEPVEPPARAPAAVEPLDDGSGVAPRNALFLRWYSAVGTETYHRPAKIAAQWNATPAAERAALCPAAPGRVTKAAVAKAIQRAREKG